MDTAPSGKLELTWTNKHLRLLADEAGGYTWVPPSDYRVAEVRLLHDVEQIGETHNDRLRAKDNLLIRGDALSALTSLCELPELAREYVGRVKLAYLDPPFNTKQAFAHYDDALEHSVWLTMMRDRLLQIRKLIAPDGSVWVHCDDSEQAYLKVMMDEVFGRENFVCIVVWEKTFSTKSSARHFSVDQDYVLVYAKKADAWRPILMPRTREADARYTNPDADPRGPWTSGPLQARNYYAQGRYEVKSPSGEKLPPPPGTYWRFSESRFLELDGGDRIYWGPGAQIFHGSNASCPRFVRESFHGQSGVEKKSATRRKRIERCASSSTKTIHSPRRSRSVSCTAWFTSPPTPATSSSTASPAPARRPPSRTSSAAAG
jgi:adenine-specific DNA-methyltransferase